MMTARFLPLLNLVGCILVTGVIFFQWRKEQGLDQRIRSISQELATSRDQTAVAEKRVLVLTGDVAQLKESIEATAAARVLTEEENARIATEHDEKMAAFATAAEQQVKTWQAAIAERDAKINELNSSLAATRSRLNEAISKLKEVGAR
jgi:chromosome segregation ATPase